MLSSVQKFFVPIPLELFLPIGFATQRSRTNQKLSIPRFSLKDRKLDKDLQVAIHWPIHILSGNLELKIGGRAREIEPHKVMYVLICI